MKRHILHSLAIALVLALAWVGCDTEPQSTAPSEPAVDVATKPVAAGDVEAVAAVQNRHTDRLLDIPGVVGTATGRRSDGSLAIKVLTEARGVSGIPAYLEGVPVEVEVTGKIVALAQVGTSTGNAKECAAGTIGARVKDSAGKLYALSNNHVYARENKAKIGEQIVSPGLYDAVPQCTFDPQTVIGTLAKFVKIQFGAKRNTVDAAVALLSTTVSNTTPAGYTPSSTAVSATVGWMVKKYGRTTGETHGTVTGVNVTVRVQYSSGIATFADQIQISPGGFSAAGDSGSLIVTDDLNANPVGLLFAGSSTTTIANRIQNVTNALGVSIDGP